MNKKRLIVWLPIILLLAWLTVTYLGNAKVINKIDMNEITSVIQENYNNTININNVENVKGWGEGVEYVIEFSVEGDNCQYRTWYIPDGKEVYDTMSYNCK